MALIPPDDAPEDVGAFTRAPCGMDLPEGEVDGGGDDQGLIGTIRGALTERPGNCTLAADLVGERLCPNAELLA